jgi:probable H4MPT-linked C1 transfer pathway protein
MWRAEAPGAAGTVIGWDVGGAHVKACLLIGGEVHDVAQWACPLWQGLQHLEAALADARRRWPQLQHAQASHAVTMTGEMVDLFSDREDGVRRISALLARHLSGAVWLYAGPGRWVAPADAAGHWPQIASANWRATAQHAAAVLGRGLLVDIGSTTTDLIAFDGGEVLGNSLSDRHRLASGELVYQGVVRTPLCALAPRITLQGEVLNVMNEFFATTADVYRLSGELDPAHDLYPSADNADKGLPATRARLARMVGCDVRDADAAEWLAFAQAWRAAQLDELAGQALRVLRRHDLDPAGLAVVAAGCGAFLVPELLARLRQPSRRAQPCGKTHACLDYGRDVARIRPGMGHDERARWARVCAPSVAVATLHGPALKLQEREVR